MLGQTQVIKIDVSKVVAGNNDRKVFDEVKLAELADSIREHGLAQPITVRPWKGVFQIVAGERRFRAISQILKWQTVPALVREMSDEDASAVMLAENTARADLNPIEEANAYQSRIEQFGWTTARVAEIAGVSEDIVNRRLSLLKLAEDIQHLVASGQFPICHAEAMVDLDSNRQRIALRVYSQGRRGMSLQSFRSLVNDLLMEQNQDSLFDLESFWIKQVQKEPEFVPWGKKAVVNAPQSDELPPVTVKRKDKLAHIFERYIADLQKAGYDSEAAAVGNLYAAMVKSRRVLLRQTPPE